MRRPAEPRLRNVFAANRAEEQKAVTGEEEKVEPLEVDEHVGKVDQVFHDLMEKASQSPEANREAVKILVSNMKQIAEHMKQSRDLRQLHDMKKQMMEQWNELLRLVDGDPEMLAAIQKWGSDFIEQKVLYYDMIADVQSELTDEAQEIEEAWTDMGAGLGQVSGMLGLTGDMTIRVLLDDLNGVALETDGIQSFIENLTNMETGHFSSPISLEKANKFLQQIQSVLIQLRTNVYQERYVEGRKPPLAETNPEVVVILDRLTELKKDLSRKIKNVSHISRVLKKVHDTHFLELYNEPPPEQALAA